MAWLNNARVAATFAVVFLHVAGQTVIDEPTGSVNWWVGNAYDSLVRWCVPVFVMLSGALLLDQNKRESLSDFYAKRVSRILVPLVAWTVFYCAWEYRYSASADLMSLVSSVLQGRPFYHLWYLYMIVFMYLFAPYLKKLASACSPLEVLILACLSLLLVVGNSILAAFRGAAEKPFPLWFLEYVPYFLLGHVINVSSKSYSKTSLGIVVALSATATAVGCYVLANDRDINAGMYFYSYLSITVVPLSVGVMSLLKKWSVPMWSEKFAERVASLSFGVYLMHPAFLDLARYKFKIAETGSLPVISIPLVAFIVFLVSLLAALALSNVPYARRLI